MDKSAILVSSLNHSRCEYHVVWIPKYRRKKLYGELRRYLANPALPRFDHYPIPNFNRGQGGRPFNEMAKGVVSELGFHVLGSIVAPQFRAPVAAISALSTAHSALSIISATFDRGQFNQNYKPNNIGAFAWGMAHDGGLKYTSRENADFQKGKIHQAMTQASKNPLASSGEQIMNFLFGEYSRPIV